MKKIVFIQPAAPESFWSLKRLTDFTKRSAIIPPLGLATVAALTPSTYHIKIIDEQIERVDVNLECDLVGITGYTVHQARMFELADHFRARGILTVAGGPYCTSHVEECQQHFDVVSPAKRSGSGPNFYGTGNKASTWTAMRKQHILTWRLPRSPGGISSN